jgi:hypothetical protein
MPRFLWARYRPAHVFFLRGSKRELFLRGSKRELLHCDI